MKKVAALVVIAGALGWLAALGQAQTPAVATAPISLDQSGFEVYAVARQDDGKLLIGGKFTTVNGQSRCNLARLNADGSLDETFTNDANNWVKTIVVTNQSIYVGGYFTQIGGQARERLAKLSTTNGALDTVFTNGANAAVHALAMGGGYLYAGGEFTNCGGAARTRLAKLDPVTGLADPVFTNTADDAVISLALQGTNLYAGGFFFWLGNKQRGRIGKMNTINGVTDDAYTNGCWNQADARVYSIIPDGSNLYVGGNFTNIGPMSGVGKVRYRVAKVSAETGAADNTFTNGLFGLGGAPDSYVFQMALSGTNLYVAGTFTSAQAKARSNVAKLNALTGEADDTFTTGATSIGSDSVRALALSGTNIFLGGNFDAVGTNAAFGIAKISPSTGAKDMAFAGYAAMTGTAYAVVCQPDGKVVIGGAFLGVNGNSRRNLARLTTGAALDETFTNQFDLEVYSLLLDGTNLYVGGAFTNLNGAPKYRLAKIHTGDGVPDSIFTNGIPGGAAYYVRDLALDGTNLYIGGNFTLAGSPDPHLRLARLSAINGAVDNFFTNLPSGTVYALALSGAALYVGGQFATVDGVARSNLAKIATASSILDATFTNGANNIVYDLLLGGTNLFLCGKFSNIGGQSRNFIARLNTTDGAPDMGWSNDANTNVHALLLDGTNLYAGGAFTHIGGMDVNRFARLNASDGLAQAEWTNGADGTVNALATDGTNLFVGGEFSRLGDAWHPGFGAIISPVTPTGLQASDGTSTNQVSLQWTGSSWAVGYGIWRHTADVSSAAASLAATASTNYNDTNAVPGTRYYYWVKATNGWGVSAFSSSDSGYRCLVPPATNTASKGAFTDRIALAWPASPGASAYGIWRHTSDVSGSAAYLTGTTETNYDDLTASAGTLYYYWVKASNTLCASDFSPSDSGYRLLSTPGGLLAGDGVSTGYIPVCWNTVAGATHYELWRNTLPILGGATRIATVTVTNYNDSADGIGYDLTCCYWVRASNSLCLSDFSSFDTGYRRLPAPQSVSASAGAWSNKIALSWSASPDAQGYQVWRHTNEASGAASLSFLAASTSSDDTAVSPGALYYYWIKATNGISTSDFSAAASGYALLPAPASVSASAGSYPDRVKVSWSAVNGALGYQLWRHTADDSSAAALLEAVASTNTDDASGAPGTLYYYWVKAVNGPRASSFSASCSGYRLLAAPGGVAATKGAFTDRVRVTWNAATNATSYEVWRHTADASGAAVKLATEPSAPLYDDTDVIQEQVYYYWVKAKNAVCTSAFSLSDSGSAATSVTVPAAPVGVTATKGAYADKVRLAWSAVSNATNYEIWRHTANDSSAAAKLDGDPTTPPGYDTNVVPDTVYYYWVKARNSAGASDFSASDSGYASSVLSPPAAPAWVAASDGAYSNKVRVSWGSVSNASSYELWRNTANDSAGAAPVASGLDSDTADDADVVPDTVYYYWVKAQNGAGASSFSPGDSGFASASGDNRYLALAGDFDGDAKADPAVQQPSSGDWQVRLSAGNYSLLTVTAFLGGAGWSALAADFDGDGKADPAIYAVATGAWRVKLSASNYATLELPAGFLGGSDWIALAADFDGDRKGDPAVYRALTGDWRLLLSSNGYAPVEAPAGFLGGAGYTPLAADFDGDGKADPAVYQAASGTWWLKLSGNGYAALTVAGFLGEAGYEALAADFDGDGLADPVVHEPVSGTWRLRLSGSGYETMSLPGFLVTP